MSWPRQRRRCRAVPPLIRPVPLVRTRPCLLLGSLLRRPRSRFLSVAKCIILRPPPRRLLLALVLSTPRRTTTTSAVRPWTRSAVFIRLLKLVQSVLRNIFWHIRPSSTRHSGPRRSRPAPLLPREHILIPGNTAASTIRKAQIVSANGSLLRRTQQSSASLPCL